MLTDDRPVVSEAGVAGRPGTSRSTADCYLRRGEDLRDWLRPAARTDPPAPRTPAADGLPWSRLRLGACRPASQPPRPPPVRELGHHLLAVLTGPQPQSAKYTITCAGSLESRRLGCLPCAATTSSTASLDSSEANTPNGTNSCNEPGGIPSTFMVTAEPYAHTDSEFSQKTDRRS